MLAYVKTDIGLVREINEDNYVFVPPSLFAVADGMGGHVAGEIASSLAATTLSEFVMRNADNGNPETLLEQAIVNANMSIYKMAQEKENCTGMGTTITSVYVNDNTIYWGHVGDSRLYLFHKNTWQQLTDDHSLVWELVKSGNITKSEAHYHPKRNMLTRAVGTSYTISVDTGVVTWEQGDMILICTDGLTSMVDEQVIFDIVQNNNNDVVLDKLIECAKAAGGKDNITTILLKNEDK